MELESDYDGVTIDDVEEPFLDDHEAYAHQNANIGLSTEVPDAKTTGEDNDVVVIDDKDDSDDDNYDADMVLSKVSMSED